MVDPVKDDLYFTLKYVARDLYRSHHHTPVRPYEHSMFNEIEKRAQNEINELLRHELPEIRLLREREQLEARLFSGDSLF